MQREAPREIKIYISRTSVRTLNCSHGSATVISEHQLVMPRFNNRGASLFMGTSLSRSHYFLHFNYREFGRKPLTIDPYCNGKIHP